MFDIVIRWTFTKVADSQSFVEIEIANLTIVPLYQSFIVSPCYSSRSACLIAMSAGLRSVPISSSSYDNSYHQHEEEVSGEAECRRCCNNKSCGAAVYQHPLVTSSLTIEDESWVHTKSCPSNKWTVNDEWCALTRGSCWSKIVCW